MHNTVSAPLHILVVDDSHQDRQQTVAVLQEHGHAVDEAANGLVAIEKASTMPYDLILMDLDMPIMDGFLATQEIRNLPFSKGTTPIVALTTTQDPEHVRQALQCGMNNFILKPLNTNKLMATTMVYSLKKQAAI